MCLNGMIGEQPLQHSKSWFRVVPSTPLLNRSKYYANTVFVGISRSQVSGQNPHDTRRSWWLKSRSFCARASNFEPVGSVGSRAGINNEGQG